MPHQAAAGALVVGGDIVLLHPLQRRGSESACRLGLEEAVLHIDDAVGPLPVEPGQRAVLSRLDGELDLVAVAAGVLRAVDDIHPHIRPADAAQGVLHPDAFGLQFLGVVHMAQLAAAALGIVQALGHNAGGGGDHRPGYPAPDGASAHLLNEHIALLAPDAALGEDHHAVQPGHARAVGGIALDEQAVGLVFSDSYFGHLANQSFDGSSFEFNSSLPAGRPER